MRDYVRRSCPADKGFSKAMGQNLVHRFGDLASSGSCWLDITFIRICCSFAFLRDSAHRFGGNRNIFYAISPSCLEPIASQTGFLLSILDLLDASGVLGSLSTITHRQHFADIYGAHINFCRAHYRQQTPGFTEYWSRLKG